MNVEIPPSLRELYEASGPILRYRIQRDVIGRDESYIATSEMGMAVAKLPAVQQILAAQDASGWWGDFRTSEVAALRLCEWGLESHRALENFCEQVLLPTLLKDDVLWEFGELELDAAGRTQARRIVRDKTLNLLCRARREDDPMVRTHLEFVLAEWEHYTAQAGTKAKETTPLPLPTADGYAAVCRYPWSDDEFPRVRDAVERLAQFSEKQPTPAHVPRALAPFLFQLLDKWQYLEQPPRLLYELELAAELGAARDLDYSAWMLDELEARQDADGFFRFPDAGDIVASWYFPLEKENPGEFYIEFTFRAELIFKRLAYDI
jgi:hypothetical protein